MNDEAIEREIEQALGTIRSTTKWHGKIQKIGPYPPGTDEEKIRQRPWKPVVWKAMNGEDIPIRAAELWQKHTPLWLRGGPLPSLGLPGSDGHFEDTAMSFRAKDVIQIRYSWAIPCPEALTVLSALSPLVEIGAGGGYWASLLRQGGADILAFDLRPYMNAQARCKWTEVEKGGPEQAANFPERTLFLCWPPYDTSMAHDCIAAYRGNCLAYIGEGVGGCNGDTKFWSLLERDWDEAADVAIPQWWGLHDYLTIYRRKA